MRRHFLKRFCSSPRPTRGSFALAALTYICQALVIEPSVASFLHINKFPKFPLRFWTETKLISNCVLKRHNS